MAWDIPGHWCPRKAEGVAAEGGGEDGDWDWDEDGDWDGDWDGAWDGDADSTARQPFGLRVGMRWMRAGHGVGCVGCPAADRGPLARAPRSELAM